MKWCRLLYREFRSKDGNIVVRCLPPWWHAMIALRRRLRAWWRGA